MRNAEMTHETNMMVMNLMADIANKFNPEQMGPELSASFMTTLKAIFVDEETARITENWND